MRPPLTESAAATMTLLYAVEGWGKTTIATQFPDPYLIAVESGYFALLRAGRVLPIPGVHARQWSQMLQQIDEIAKEPGGVRTLVLDSITAAEPMCESFVIGSKPFNGDRSKYESFKKGRAYLVAAWRQMLGKLERVVDAGVDVLLLGHATDVSYQNPTGDDFLQTKPAGDKAVVDVTKRTVNNILFGRFEVTADGNKAQSTRRVLECRKSGAWDAKSQSGYPAQIVFPENPDEMYATLMKETQA